MATQARNPNTPPALASLLRDCGDKLPAQLTTHDVQRAANDWRTARTRPRDGHPALSDHTRANYGKRLRRFLRWLEQTAGARPTIADAVPRFRQPAARTIIATDDERRLVLANAYPALRFFLLLCSDLGIRHGTAARICPANYDARTKTLAFFTKGGVHQTLPVTPEIAEVFAKLPKDAQPGTSVVNILRAHNPRGHQPGNQARFTKQWRALKKRLGIRDDLHIHDLRRTVAEDVWSATHDLRAVQHQLGHQRITTTAKYLERTINLEELSVTLARVAALRAQRLVEAEREHEAQLRAITSTGATFNA